MRILTIDDDPAALRVLAELLKRIGHTVNAYARPEDALAALYPGVDLIISDVFMPALDGFALATRVAAVLGSAPPRTLLMSGGEYADRLRQSLPDTVIGLIRKPPSIAKLRIILDALSKTRTRCPGLVIAELRGDRQPDAECLAHGEGRNYAACPHYNSKCGKMLREWIAHQTESKN